MRSALSSPIKQEDNERVSDKDGDEHHLKEEQPYVVTYKNKEK